MDETSAPTQPTLKLGRVQPGAAQAILDWLNQIIEARRGTMEIEVREADVYIRPHPSIKMRIIDDESDAA